jgi:hypothetical protein
MICKKNILFVLLVYLLTSLTLRAQISFGVQIQNFGRSGGGGGQVDSMVVITNSNAQLLEYPPQGVGLFFEYQLKSRFPVMIRSELNYRGGKPSGLQLFVFNSITGKTSASNYSELKQSYKLEIPIDLGYTLFKRGLRLLNKSVEFEAGLLAGVSFQFQSTSNQVIYQKQPLNSSGVDDVNSAINNSIRATNYFYNYGFRVKLWNFILIYRVDQLLNNSAIKDLSLWGNSYPLKVSYEYQSISLGYKLNLKRK